MRVIDIDALCRVFRVFRVCTSRSLHAPARSASERGGGGNVLFSLLLRGLGPGRSVTSRVEGRGRVGLKGRRARRRRARCCRRAGGTGSQPSAACVARVQASLRSSFRFVGRHLISDIISATAARPGARAPASRCSCSASRRSCSGFRSTTATRRGARAPASRCSAARRDRSAARRRRATPARRRAPALAPAGNSTRDDRPPGKDGRP